MKKKLLSIIIPIVITSISNISYAQNTPGGGGLTKEQKTSLLDVQCDLAESKQQYLLLNAAVAIDDYETTEVLLKNFCYDLSYLKKFNIQTNPIFVAKSLKMVELLTSYFEFEDTYFSGLNLDPIMNHYVQPIFLTSIEEQVQTISVAKNIYKEMGIPFLSNKSEKSLAYELRMKIILNKSAIVNHLLEIDIEKQKYTNKKKIYTHLDVNGNEILHYIIYMGDANTLEKFLKEQAYNTAKKTRLIRVTSNISPLSLVFNIKRVYKNDVYQNKLIKKINDLTLNEIKFSKLYLNQPTLYGNTFFQFAYIMRHKNPDFYLKLRKMFPKEDYAPVNIEKTKESFEKDSNLFEIVKYWVNE